MSMELGGGVLLVLAMCPHPLSPLNCWLLLQYPLASGEYLPSPQPPLPYLQLVLVCTNCVHTPHQDDLSLPQCPAST